MLWPHQFLVVVISSLSFSSLFLLFSLSLYRLKLDILKANQFIIQNASWIFYLIRVYLHLNHISSFCYCLHRVVSTKFVVIVKSHSNVLSCARTHTHKRLLHYFCFDRSFHSQAFSCLSPQYFLIEFIFILTMSFTMVLHSMSAQSA